MLVYIIILGLLVAVVVLAYRLYMTKAYYKYDKDRLNKAEEDFAKKESASSEELEISTNSSFSISVVSICSVKSSLFSNSKSIFFFPFYANTPNYNTA